MGGLANLFKKIIPFITLICFVCFGITYAFKDTNKQLTYLTTQYYDINTGNIIENPTAEEKENAEKLYTFDMVNYAKNIDQDILTRSTKDVIDLEAYTNTAEQFNNIWQNGYQIGDVVKTILNGILMVINTIILIINVLLFPVRILSGIILTAISIVGVNINNGIFLIPFLKFLLDKFRIPFINPTTEKQATPLTETTWIFNESKILANAPTKKNAVTRLNINFYVEISTTKAEKYTQIEIYRTYGNAITMTFYNGNIANKMVYDNGWINLKYATIKISDTNMSNDEVTKATSWLNKYATKQTQRISERQPLQRIYKISSKNEYYLQYC